MAQQFVPTGAPNAPAGPTAMTHCNNCGHTGTFVLLVQFALAVPDLDAYSDSDASAEVRDNSSSAEGCTANETRPSPGGFSLAVQCPACDSTDVGVAADDLLARYGSSTTS